MKVEIELPSWSVKLIEAELPYSIKTHIRKLIIEHAKELKESINNNNNHKDAN